MADGSATEQIAWIERVLGIDLPGASETETGPDGDLSLVQLGIARVEFLSVQRQALGQLARLRSTLRNQYEDDAEQQDALARADTLLQGIEAGLGEALNDELDAVLNQADEAERRKLAGTARKTMQRLAALVDGNPIVAELDGNEVLPDMAVRAPLSARLRAIAAALG